MFMYKMGLTLNNLQRLICHKAKPHQNKSRSAQLLCTQNFLKDDYQHIICVYRSEKLGRTRHRLFA